MKFFNPFSNNCGGITGIIEALALGAGLFGASELVKGLGDTPKAPKAADLPNKDDANKDAAATIADQRKALLLSGGQTDYTGGLGALTGSDVSKTTLIGG